MHGVGRVQGPSEEAFLSKVEVVVYEVVEGRDLEHSDEEQELGSNPSSTRDSSVTYADVINLPGSWYSPC